MVMVIIKKMMISFCIYIVFSLPFIKRPSYLTGIATFLSCCALDCLFYFLKVRPRVLYNFSLLHGLVNLKPLQYLFDGSFNRHFLTINFVIMHLLFFAHVFMAMKKGLPPMKMKGVSAFFIAGIILLQVATIDQLWITRENISIGDGEFDSIRIVQISDLHSSIYPGNQESLINKVLMENPDLVFLTGDIADDHEDFEGTRLLLEGLSPYVPLYYVSGNHEFWASDYWETYDKIKSYGVIMLEDDFVEIELKGRRLFIAGVDDPFGYIKKGPNLGMSDKMNILNTLALDRDCDINLLLSHRPEFVQYYSVSSFDLVFSGHAHGGQIRIPFTNIAAYAPNQGVLPSYNNGLYELEHTILVVSRGLAINGNLPRIFNTPELMVINIL